MKKLEKVKNILHEKKLRVTQSRLAVASILIDQEENLLTSDEIFKLIKDMQGMI